MANIGKIISARGPVIDIAFASEDKLPRLNTAIRIQNGEEELVESTLIAVQYLPEADVSELKQGIKVYGMEEVNKIIEDFE